MIPETVVLPNVVFQLRSPMGAGTTAMHLAAPAKSHRDEAHQY